MRHATGWFVLQKRACSLLFSQYIETENIKKEHPNSIKKTLHFNIQWESATLSNESKNLSKWKAIWSNFSRVPSWKNAPCCFLLINITSHEVDKKGKYYINMNTCIQQNTFLRPAFHNRGTAPVTISQTTVLGEVIWLRKKHKPVPQVGVKTFDFWNEKITIWAPVI